MSTSELLFDQELPHNFKSQNLDLALVDLLEISRKKSQKLVDLGLVLVNHKRANRRSQVLKAFDYLEVLKPVEIETKKIPILFENDDFVVINKPSGLSLEAKSNQLNLSILPILKKQLNLKELFLVHRLDTETSGVLIIAKNLTTEEKLLASFKDKKIAKTYLAIALGLVQKSSGTIDSPIMRVKPGANKYKVDSNGVWSKTDYKILKTNLKEKLSLVELSPKTGRSHQIRVHLSSVGLPILGDKIYAAISHAKLNRATHLMLCAVKLQFELDGEKYEFEAGLDPEFSKLVELYF